jgi:hypothetical protein
MNKVVLVSQSNKVDVQMNHNHVNIEVIRVHTDTYFLSTYQTIPQHKEVK